MNLKKKKPEEENSSEGNGNHINSRELKLSKFDAPWWLQGHRIILNFQFMASTALQPSTAGDPSPGGWGTERQTAATWEAGIKEAGEEGLEEGSQKRLEDA